MYLFILSFYDRSRGNKAYILHMDVGKIPVYCHMTSHGLGACGGGGWTLVMKIDGHKVTSPLLKTCFSVKNDNQNKEKVSFRL